MTIPVAEQAEERVQSVGSRYFTEQEYETIRQAGLLRADERTEWIDGGIFEYGAQGVQPRRFTTKEYYWLVEIGVLEPKARVELIEGIVVNKMSKVSIHAAFISFLTAYFYNLVGSHLQIRSQQPTHVSMYNEPEPDIALVDARADFYRSGHPTPADAHVLIEISDTSLCFDRTEKVNLYARAGIPEVWIIDVKRLIIYQYEQPADGIYGAVHTRRKADSFVSQALSDLTINCETLFAPFKV